MQIIERDDTNGVAHLRMNAPERFNALSDEMLAGFQQQIDMLQQDTSVRAIVISGAGKVFCAGHDLRQIQAARQSEDRGRSAFQDLFARCTAVMTGLQRLPQPVIAQVHGIATAAGCQLVASCDLAIAADDTRFGVNGVNIGLFCSTPMVALSRNIPRKQAFEMLSTGDFITAAKAEQLGLINKSVPAENLPETTQEMAQKVASKLSSAVKIGKQAFYEQLQMPLDQAYAYTGDVITENLMWQDTEEGINAFLEKRPPNWT
ncbi:MAG: enoyl-CoA hydratase [Pelagimonas sp.]|jgi:enoyl-CoA hydratase/carnithine racemase|nr:enoyl-CoA hydratase [Pelagimonas sp.]